MPGTSHPVEVFYSYAHEDEALRAELEKHVSLLRRLGVISGWHDRHIAPGNDWAQAIDEHLERAAVILLLVSADFLASDFCYGIEMQRALERHQAHEAAVIPVLLRAVDWRGAPFANLKALLTDARAITSWRNRDAAFMDVAAGMRRAVEDLSSLQATAPRAALPPVWNVPYPRNPFFIGRDALLSVLHGRAVGTRGDDRGANELVCHDRLPAQPARTGDAGAGHHHPGGQDVVADPPRVAAHPG